MVEEHRECDQWEGHRECEGWEEEKGQDGGYATMKEYKINTRPEGSPYR